MRIRLQTIRETFERHGQMIDPHTADGLKVAREQLQAGVPMIVLETALPIKFAATLVEALGREPDRPPRFNGIEALPRRVQVLTRRGGSRQGHHRRALPMNVIGFTGFSGAGKTTLVEGLVRAMRAQGLRVSVIKHARNGFELDQPGKDSYRHREAGAFEVLVASNPSPGAATRV